MLPPSLCIQAAQYLTAIVEGCIYPIMPSLGVCTNLRSYLHVEDRQVRKAYMEFIQSLMKSWPHYSGMEDYPIPHPTMSAKDAYLNGDIHMWDTSTEYGRLRLDLCEYLASVLYRLALQEHRNDSSY